MYHFDHEEQLMAKHGYPMLPNHRAGHTQFCEVISETNYGGVLGIIEVSDLTDYLIRWWKSHILLEDMQYKPFFTEKGVN
jgi:hemerythrin-like metal-binding protein